MNNSLHLSQEFFQYVSCSGEGEIIHLEFPRYFATLQKAKLIWNQSACVQNEIRVVHFCSLFQIQEISVVLFALFFFFFLSKGAKILKSYGNSKITRIIYYLKSFSNL